jgi:hypothetical protein
MITSRRDRFHGCDHRLVVTLLGIAAASVAGNASAAESW